jgi:D-alanyl-D-alanine carboxypeptidase
VPSASAERIQAVMSCPEFAHSNCGIEFFDVQTGQMLYALNSDKMFVPGFDDQVAYGRSRAG